MTTVLATVSGQRPAAGPLMTAPAHEAMKGDENSDERGRLGPAVADHGEDGWP